MGRTPTHMTTAATTSLDPELRRAHLRWMLASRRLEERLRSIYRQGRVTGGVYLSIGQEALSAACGMLLRRDDIFAPLIRDSAGRLAHGEQPLEVLRHYLGKGTALMRGRDGNIHRGDLSRNILPMVSHLGATLAPCSGMLLARRLRGVTGDVALACLGDGGSNTGAAHEAINAAAVSRLPLVVVIADNGYAYSTPTAQTYACEDLTDRAIGYGIGAHRCDGTDAAACLQTVGQAIDAARTESRPQLLVAKLLRLSGHGEHDDASYIDPALRERYPDCLPRALTALTDEGLLDAATLQAWEDELAERYDRLIDQVLAEPDAVPADEDWQSTAGKWPFAVAEEIGR